MNTSQISVVNVLVIQDIQHDDLRDIYEIFEFFYNKKSPVMKKTGGLYYRELL